jgi:hypothetical protein
MEYTIDEINNKSIPQHSLGYKKPADIVYGI